MTCLLLYLWQTILFLSCNVYLIQTKALKCVFTPDTYQNDITWWLEQIDESGIATLIAEGSGSTNKMETPVGLTVDDNACLRYRILDSYGDGGGFITVYWGDDLTTPSTTFLNHAFSAAYNAGNGGGDPGTSEFLFQDGVGVLGTVCSFDSMTKPDTGCHEDIAVDIIFVMDTSSDLTQYCQSHYWDAIIDLVEHHVPRTDLQIAIVTYGSDDVDHLLFRPFSTPKDGIATSHDIKSCSFGFQGSWVNYLRPMLQSFGSSECIGGGHSTISALDMAIQMFANKYGQMYDPSRRRYIILMTDSTIDVDQTQTFDSDPYSSFILLSASDAPNPHLSRLIAHDDNLILLESFSQIKDAYVLVEDIVCSTEIDIAVTEIFIDDMNNRYWFEIVNLGRPLNVSELVFGGNLFTGSALDNAEIPQGDLFVIGNMFGSSDTPCDIYGGDIASSSLNYDCTNYYAVDYDGNATLSSFSLSINDRYGSEIAANALEIEAGYSYELSTIYLGFSNMTNWRESCDRYGSPGRFGRQYCNARSCDAVKCASRGDVSATCYGTCTTVQEGSSSDFIGDWEFCAPSNGCNCGLNYYYDENDTRSCIDVPTVVDCSAYVIQADANLIEVTWTASPYENAAFYSIKYGDSGVTDGLTDPDDQNIQITFSEYAISPVRMTVIGTDANDNSVVESTETICIYGQTLNPTSTPTAVPSVAPIQQTKAPTFAGGCGSSLRLDLMIIMDSSGSVYNRETGEDPFKYWNNELDFVKTIVNKSLPGDSRVGAINFSGCGSSYDKTTCRYTAGQLVRLWGLLDFGMPNDPEALYQRVDEIDSNDFIGGYTWTDEALGIALEEFKANSTAGRKRMILLLTDGEPYPRTDTYDHDPCYREWNSDISGFEILHESDNLKALRELDVTILAIGIGLTEQFIDQFFKCLVSDFNEHFFEATDFSALDSLVESIATIICPNASESYSQIHVGPFFYPNGDYTDPIYIIFGEHNATHFFVNLFVTGDHWFGFAFASGTGCTQSLSDNNQCRMEETDAIIFGDYGGSDSLTVKEYILGNHTSPTLQRTQNIGSDVSSQLFDGVRDFTVRVKRPYDPSMYGNRNGYVINSPLAGSFCWLWAQGDGIFFGPSAGHLNRGSECVDMGTTVAPTPSPSAPTISPSNTPSNDPTISPSNAPTISPSNTPSNAPTISPSNAPTISPSNTPSNAPTACVDYESSFVRYTSNDGHDNKSITNLSPQLQDAFYVNNNESVQYYKDTPTVDIPVPYINALIECNATNSKVCHIHCIGTASCLLSNIIPYSDSIERILIKCEKKFSCKSMKLNYTEAASPQLHTIIIECSAPYACNEFDINFLSTIHSHSILTNLSVNVYCLESLSCQSTAIHIQEAFVFEMHVNVYCVKENSCKQLLILNEHNTDINIDVWSFQYSEDVKVKTSDVGYDLVHIHCGNEKDARYLRYDTAELLNDDELLRKAREEYTARRLPCEGIDITCSSIIDDQVYEEECSMQYALSDAVDVTEIIKSTRNCFWIDINRLYTPQCYGNCGQNVTIYEYMMSVELEMRIGISADDKKELYAFYNNDTSALDIDEIVCNEYFGNSNLTLQTLTNIDAIVNAAVRVYKENDLIHKTANNAHSQIINGSIDCDVFDMQNDVILINSTFSVQSISSNGDEVDVFFAHDSLFHDVVNDLFSEYYGEGMIPIFVAKTATAPPSTDPTPGPTRSPIECPYNYFRYNITKECFECDADDVGYECKGADLFSVEYGYWVSAHPKNGFSISSLHSITSNHDIISLQCPMGQCCLNPTGCDYFGNESPLLCAEHRNVSSVACSRCDAGHVELFGSFACGQCNQTDYALVVLLFVFAMLFTLFLLFIMSKPSALRENIKQQQEVDWRKLLVYDQKNLLLILISKICMYYYQGLSQILSAKNITISSQFQRALLTLFDFDIALFSSGNRNGICFIAGIDSGIYKLLMSYAWYVFVALNVVIIALLSRVQCLCKRMPCSYRPYIKVGCINIILMTAGPLLSISFKVLTCVKFIDGKHYHFYDTDVACHGNVWWFVGVLPITILCGTLIAFWWIVYKQGAQQREDEINPYRSFTKRFNYNMWYWEFILYLRRFGIAALTSFYGIANTLTSIVLASFIVLLLALQTKFNPFKYQRANMMESLCLFGTATIMVALIVIQGDSIYITWYLTLLILGPFCIVCIIIADVLYKRRKLKHMNTVTKERLERRWVTTDIEMQMQPVRRIKSRLSMQEQIQSADSLQQLMPFIQRIDIDELKNMLVAHYDGIDTNTGEDTIKIPVEEQDELIAHYDGIDTNQDEGMATLNISKVYSDGDEPVEATEFHHRGACKDRTESKSVHDNIPNRMAMDDPTETDQKKDAEETIKIPVEEQDELIQLYQTNRNMWRNRMTTTISQHPHQFQIILEILNNNNTGDDDNDETGLTMDKFQNSFPALNNALVEYMFEDIGSFDDNRKSEDMLKITTIVRWMNFESVFEEVECVNDRDIVVILYHKLDKYLEYVPGENGKGAIIKRMKRNKYGKPLSDKYGLNKTEADEPWFIEGIDGKSVSNNMERDINDILKRLDPPKGYQVRFKRTKKS